MNANELADKLLAASSDMEHNFHVSDWKLLFECALVMRNQQAKLECYGRLVDASEMASNPMGVKSREALRNANARIMAIEEDTYRATLRNATERVMTKEEEILRAVEAEREACAKLCEEYAIGLERNYSEIIADKIRARGKE